MYVNRVSVQSIGNFLSSSQWNCSLHVNSIFLQQLAPKLEALQDEYMRFAVEKCGSVLREYHSAVETITGSILVVDSPFFPPFFPVIFSLLLL